MAKIVVFGGFPESLLNFRGVMLEAMVREGHDVHALSPPASHDVIAGLARIGVMHHTIPLARTGLNPFHDLSSLIALVKLLRHLQPDRMLSYTVKPVVYGGLAAQVAGIPFYAMITGLGYGFSNSGLKGKILKKIIVILYRLGLRCAKSVFFQNPDNQKIFQDNQLLKKADQAVLINGSGVDTCLYQQQPFSEKPQAKNLKFLMVARLLHDKGVVEYVEAARTIKKRAPDTQFRLAGWIDNRNPAAISQETLENWISEGVIHYLGKLDDVRPALSDCMLYVLPSYHEGMPRTVLEAMSTGRAIITTDTSGCRETVTEGTNGFLVPVADAKALTAAMQKFLDKPGLVMDMGQASRKIAEERFDVHKVNQVILKTMDLM